MGVVYVGNGGSGLLFLLLFLGMFVLLPILFVRSAFRSSGVVARGSWPVGQQDGYDPQPAPQPAPQPVHAAEVRSVVTRLAHDIGTLQAGDDQVARQAMADASERYATASAQLERARSQDQLRTSWLAAAEGLHATRLVRSRLGLDPGPAPALPPGSGPQLQHRSRVTVDGREHVGAPAYEPGHDHWFPGGRVGDRYVPGGWYAESFWPGSLVLGVLSGWALGSLMSGAVFGGLGLPGVGGYDNDGWSGGWGEDSGGGGWGGGWGDSGGGGWGDVGGGGGFGGDW